ncbi:hypothetical protein KC367_g7008 [Hortaea werneckii]|nr:hypothetical protein KC358_g7851 [Hortaea werneckii]KAI6830331.1 hypothetical protein KC350_g7618 [Hortaea werneckii]KAI6834539.1 hypothetical protein KC342_g6228 [Hortaea werneckii]KAI6927596.1 hypothetical protein KC348_g8354 [Hortaea werneckii]KAI6934302.1 hypothetical protein KC341_g7685 [Hortaea werneckii]
MPTTPEALPQCLIESWRQAQEDLDNRIQNAEATLETLIDDFHSTQQKVQLCNDKLKRHPYDDGSKAELKVQLEDFKGKESNKLASIQARLQQISSLMEETFRERCAEEARAVGMKVRSPEAGARDLFEQWRLITLQLWELRDKMVASHEQTVNSRKG